MKKIISQSILMILLCVIDSKIASSQVVWDADCTNLNPPFTVSFRKRMATVTLKMWEYDLPFSGSAVSAGGEHLSGYKTKQLAITTKYPLDNYVTLSNHESITIIAQGYCKK